MAVIVNGDGILTGVSSLTTALDDITSGRGTVTGVTTVGTLQLGAGVSISSPRSQNAAIFTNNTEFFTVDDAGRVGVGTITPNSDAHPENEKKINVGFITARSIAGDIDANTMVVAGISTFTGAIDVNSTSNFGDNLTVSSGNLTMSGAGNIVLGDSASGTDDRITFGASTDLEIFHNGTNNHIDCHTAGQELYIRPTKDVYFQDYVTDDVLLKMVKDGAVELYFDNSKKFQTTPSGVDVSGTLNVTGVTTITNTLTLTNDLFMLDGDQIEIGTDNDLKIFHSGFNYIESHNDIEVHINAYTGGAVENMAKFKPNGAVELYHNGTLKLNTSSAGVTVQNGHLVMNRQDTGNEGGEIVLNRASDNSGQWVNDVYGNDSSARLRWHNGGVEKLNLLTSGNVEIPNGNLVIGTSGKGIDFSATGGGTNGTDTNELLDDYEEGTWTPVPILTYNPGGRSITAASGAEGIYVKIGRFVHVEYKVGWTALSGSGAYNIGCTGLPYAADNTVNVVSGTARSNQTGYTFVAEGLQATQINVFRKYDNGGPNENDVMYGFATYQTT